MFFKRKSDSFDGGDGEKRKAITMEVKLDIVKRAEMGETVMNIGAYSLFVVLWWQLLLRIRSVSLNM